ncbi:MarR family winged helix-turn-helix transcriptional regulator [Ferviditalea candida]|uniref:MarR family transcriptional regulator n=1 Tax=Ferviditalea candida TaxID=3108399 RepID=A0ABU5ZFI3_9BACL|nr:MarR family transcriptional regulator [Paenibacillaceae bacterium T2]
MHEHSMETIEIELAILARRLTSNDKKVGNLDRSAYLLLHQISAHGSAGVKALAEEFHLDISTVSRQTAALEQKGYARKIPDPSDGRAYSLEITDKGAKQLHQYKQARMARVKELLKHWSEDERQLFGNLLTKFNRTFID